MSEKKTTNVESWGDSIFAFFVVAAVLALLFSGDPSIAESLRIWIGKAAGTIPVDYVYVSTE